jgi:succinate-semialdehyde dehydrogenase / glutarate-semialdehyde dehydrogenase
VEAEAIERANDRPHDLAGCVYTCDLARSMRVSEYLEFGMTDLNRGLVSDPALPFGGVKRSAIDREGAHEGIKEFPETQHVSVTW